jgi:hypothetical protein
MLQVQTQGKERDFEGYCELLGQAGFVDVKCARCSSSGAYLDAILARRT